MLPFQTLLFINKNLAAPVYQQISNGIIGLIQDGTIVPGTFLPSSRVMAEMLTLHRKTIVAAYEELAAQDWIETIPRKGMMVARNLPELKPRSFKTAAQASSYKTKTAVFYERISAIQSVGSKNKSYRFVINDGFPDSRIAPVDTFIATIPLFITKTFFRPASNVFRSGGHNQFSFSTHWFSFRYKGIEY